MKPKIAGLLFLVLLSTTFIQAQTTQDLSIVSIKTIDGNQFIGKITYQDSNIIVLANQYVGPITILKTNIQNLESRNRFDEIRKNAISANLLGSSSIVGLTYERLLSERISAEFGAGYLGVGAGLKIFTSGVKEDKTMFHTGATVTFYTELEATIAYIPIGSSYFGKQGLNFGIDIGPAIISDGDMSIFFLWGNLKLGIRF